jgi:hypothetical protein
MFALKTKLHLKQSRHWKELMKAYGNLLKEALHHLKYQPEHNLRLQIIWFQEKYLANATWILSWICVGGWVPEEEGHTARVYRIGHQEVCIDWCLDVDVLGGNEGISHQQKNFVSQVFELPVFTYVCIYQTFLFSVVCQLYFGVCFEVRVLPEKNFAMPGIWKLRVHEVIGAPAHYLHYGLYVKGMPERDAGIMCTLQTIGGYSPPIKWLESCGKQGRE